MKSIFVVAVVLTGLTALAANDPAALQKSADPTSTFQCLDLRKAAQKLPVYASNIANSETTRTPAGGPYKRIELVCKQMYCEQIAKDDFKLMHAPDHPDANSAGYVRLPVINIGSEYAALTSAASEIRMLASTGTCGASALASSMSAMIKYDAGASVQSDTFNYAADGHITSWSRTLRDGSSKHMAFAADGSMQKN